MNDREIKNAKITGVSIGFEHGCLTCSLSLDYGGSGQGFGGYALDEPFHVNGEFKGRKGTAWGAEFIIRILKTLEVERWEDLPGQAIRAYASDEKVHKIGHFIKDQWFDPTADIEWET